MIPIYYILILLMSSFQQSTLTAKDVVKHSVDQMRGETSEAELIIKTVRPTWEREMVVKSWLKGEKYAMILIKSPIKERGVAFLKRDKEVWNWIPSLDRSIKLPPSMMTQSWMGTDFTNDDLVKESSVVEDYEHSFAGDTVIDGRDCHVITMIPKPEAAVVWGMLVICIDKKDYLELHTRFYDEEGELLNTLNASDVKMMGGRLIPTYIEMIPADKKNQKTILIYSSMNYDRPIQESFFTVQYMKNLK